MLHAATTVTFDLDDADLDDLTGMITIARGMGEGGGDGSLTAAEARSPAFGFQRLDAAAIERGGRARPAPFQPFRSHRDPRRLSFFPPAISP